MPQIVSIRGELKLYRPALYEQPESAAEGKRSPWIFLSDVGNYEATQDPFAAVRAAKAAAQSMGIPFVSKHRDPNRVGRTPMTPKHKAKIERAWVEWSKKHGSERLAILDGLLILTRFTKNAVSFGVAFDGRPSFSRKDHDFSARIYALQDRWIADNQRFFVGASRMLHADARDGSESEALEAAGGEPSEMPTAHFGRPRYIHRFAVDGQVRELCSFVAPTSEVDDVESVAQESVAQESVAQESVAQEPFRTPLSDDEIKGVGVTLGILYESIKVGVGNLKAKERDSRLKKLSAAAPRAQALVAKGSPPDHARPVATPGMAIRLPASVTIKELASLMGVPLVDVLSKLESKGLRLSPAARVEGEGAKRIAKAFGVVAECTQ